MKFAVTDYIVLVLLFFSLIGGWRKGVVRSLFAPFSVIVCIFCAYRYYQNSGDFVIALMIVIGGPILLHLLFITVMYFINKFKPEEPKTSVPSRFSGGLISLVWSALFLSIPFYFFSLSPLHMVGLDSLKEQVAASRSYQFYAAYFFEPIDKALNLTPKKQASKGAGRLTAGVEAPPETLQESEEFQALMKDPRVEALLKDEEVIQHMEQKDILGLFRNPKVQEILSDEKLVRKFLQLNVKLNEYHPELQQNPQVASDVDYHEIIQKMKAQNLNQ